jgi:hypothetical protein
MRAEDSERVVATGEMGDQNDGGKERKSFQEVCRRAVDTARHSWQRRHCFITVTGSPTVSVLIADEVGSSDQMSEPDEDAPNQKVKFCGRERGLFSRLCGGLNSFTSET